MNVLRHIKRLILVFIGIIALACVGNFVGCEPQTATLPAEAVPAQENFYQEKIWTEADFRAAEVPSDHTDYLKPCESHTGHCYVYTEQDLKLIAQHYQNQLNQFIAEYKNENHRRASH